MTNPVTQTAEVAVNSASMGGVIVRVWVAIGSIKRKLPNKITATNPNRMTRKGDILFLCTSCLICYPLIHLYFLFTLNIIHI